MLWRIMAFTQPDRDILRRAQAGDERAFAIILRQYHTPIYNYVLRVLLGDRALAEDLCQEIFVRVHRALPRFDDRSLFTTWLFQIAKNRLVDELRSRERRIRPSVALDSVWPLGLAAPVSPAVEDMDIVWRAIGALSPDLKMALVLRDVVGLSYAEIADSLETTLAAVKWRIYKARETVAAELTREGLDRPAAVMPGGRRA
jgi:RNA polymerase sigma-70 factor, ECF subfamily